MSAGLRIKLRVAPFAEANGIEYIGLPAGKVLAMTADEIWLLTDFGDEKSGWAAANDLRLGDLTGLPRIQPVQITATADALAKSVAATATRQMAIAIATGTAEARQRVAEAKATDTARIANWKTVDIRELVKAPDKYFAQELAYSGTIFNIEDTGGIVAFQMWVPSPAGGTEAVVVRWAGDSTGLFKGSFVRVLGVGAGKLSGRNAFGGTVTQPVINAVYVNP